ncbi:MAG TPA: hypothetical protein VI322_04970 [Candidatus Saccharimonadia bacterium]
MSKLEYLAMESRKAAMLATATKLAEYRNRPLLVLQLEEVRKIHALEVHKLLFDKQFEALDVILQTPGGDINAAYLIAKMLRSHAKQISVLVPLFAKSAGTLICMGCDCIMLTDLSELGPLDTQIPERKDGGDPEYVSALNGSKALEQVRLHAAETLDIVTQLIMSRSQMNTAEAVKLANEFVGQTAAKLYDNLEPDKIGEYARSLEIGERYGVALLTQHLGWPEEKADRTVKKLVYDYPSHGFAIDQQELESLGFNSVLVKSELLDLTMQLREEVLKLYQYDESLVELVNSDNIKSGGDA